MYINGDTVINLRGVIFAAIVIGALGATMDVAMSIASSLDEILFHKPDISDLDLMRSGLNIGRDIMGTMANTLVLAYVGSSLHLILLLMAYNNDIGAIVNRESIAVELLQSVAGSIGILFTVPATAAVTVAAGGGLSPTPGRNRRRRPPCWPGRRFRRRYRYSRSRRSRSGLLWSTPNRRLPSPRRRRRPRRWSSCGGSTDRNRTEQIPETRAEQSSAPCFVSSLRLKKGENGTGKVKSFTNLMQNRSDRH